MIAAKYMPVVSVDKIENELIARGVSSKYAYNVRQMMFDDRYMNIYTMLNYMGKGAKMGSNY